MITEGRAAYVLLVEDDDGDALLVQEGFAEAGAKVDLHRVRTGDAALEILTQVRLGRAPRPDLVLLDLNLPGIKGLDVLRAIRGARELAEMPVVVLTTSDDDRHVRQVYAEHGNAYVTKPGDLPGFLDAISDVHDFWVETARLP